MNEQLKDPLAVPQWRGDHMRIEYEVVALDKRRIAYCCRESSHDSYRVQLVARTYWVFHIPISSAIPQFKNTESLNVTKGKRNRIKEKQRKKGGIDGKIYVQGGNRLNIYSFVFCWCDYKLYT